MMKNDETTVRRIAIAYATKHGTTEKVAQRLAAMLPTADVTLFDLSKEPYPDLYSFDGVVVGGSVYAGRVRPQVAKFCARSMPVLLQKRVALFICAMNDKEYESELQNAFPSELHSHAELACVVGGEFLFDRMNFIERFLVKKISGITRTVSMLDEDKISLLAKAMVW